MHRILAAFALGLFLGLGAPVLFQASMTSAVESAATIFSDVEGDSYYDESVLDMMRRGIIKGYNDGRFGPGDPVTRAQAAVLLARYHNRVVKPLYKRVQALEEHLNLDECGDGYRGKNEECDDGNQVDGDGCSAECIKEEKPEPRTCPDGHKIGESFPASDGCNTCSCTDSGQIVCTMKACLPEAECVPCGESCIPKDEAATALCTVSPNSLSCALRDGECVRVEKKPSPLQCEIRKEKLADFIRSKRACRTDDDCAVLVRGCSPYLTCGQPVNKAGLGDVKIAIADYIEACEMHEQPVCAQCMQKSAVCEEGFCRLQEVETCTEEAKICPNGTSVNRNPDLNCAFDPCPNTSSCGNGICEQNEVNFPSMSPILNYCPEDCQDTCGNRVCDEGETSIPTTAPYPLYCPADCGSDESGSLQE